MAGWVVTYPPQPAVFPESSLPLLANFVFLGSPAGNQLKTFRDEYVHYLHHHRMVTAGYYKYLIFKSSPMGRFLKKLFCTVKRGV